MPRKVLVIEDEVIIQRLIKNVLRRFELEVLSALTLSEACDLFQLNQEEIIIVVIDGSIETPDKLDTIPLIRKISENFDRPIVAISSREDFNQALLQNGCTHYGQKPDIIDPILDAVRDCQDKILN